MRTSTSVRRRTRTAATVPDRSSRNRSTPMLLTLVVAERAVGRLRERRPIQIAGQRLLSVDVIRDLVDSLIRVAVERVVAPVITVSQLPERALRIPDTRQFEASTRSAALANCGV